MVPIYILINKILLYYITTFIPEVKYILSIAYIQSEGAWLTQHDGQPLQHTIQKEEPLFGPEGSPAVHANPDLGPRNELV